MDISSTLTVSGFAVIKEYLPKTSGVVAFSELGKVVQLPGVEAVQVLTPRRSDTSPPNTYSGNFGVGEFPLHTDLAHWFLPPRYFALRCVVGSRHVSTRLVDAEDLKADVGRRALIRALVRPRRPLRGNRPLLRLLDRRKDGNELFRWDSLFVAPATNESRVVWKAVTDCLGFIEPQEIRLDNPGDTLILDNWRMLHGRSMVVVGDEQRRIERAYLGEVY